MSVAVAEKKSLDLKWDTFLERSLQKAYEGRPEGFREQVAQEFRNGIDMFRHNEWKNIVRELAQRYLLEIPEGLEPHWIGPGIAVYWQKQVLRVRVKDNDPDGREIWRIEEKTTGWTPTEQGLPANNASQISHYLEKGLRLRPPGKGLEPHVLQEFVPYVKAPEVLPEHIYFCSRHADKTNMGFRTWKQYLKHCDHFMEELGFEPPADVKERMQGFKYFCVPHNVGFQSYRLAHRHYQTEQRMSPHKRSFRLHKRPSEMRVLSEQKSRRS